MAAPNPSRLDANQVLQGAFDEANGRIRTDAEATIVNADIDIQLDAQDDNVAIADLDGDFLEINTDGSINAKAEITNTVTVEVSGPITVNPVQVSGVVEVEVQNDIQVSGITTPINVNPVEISGVVEVEVQNAIQVSEIVAPINVNPVEISGPVVISEITTPVEVTISDPLITTIRGTEDGNPNSDPYYLVYNQKSQILDSHDRIAQFTYADFGTKNQRITQINYTSPTFPGITLQRVFNYTLVGNSYRRDDEIWTVI